MKRKEFLTDLTKVDFEVKIADYGLARVLHKGELAGTPCGKAEVMAPEAMEPGFDSRVDVWGVGIICYMLLTSSNVFLNSEQFNQGTWSISTELNYSIECLRFMNETLQFDKELRPFPDALKDHPYLRCNLHTQLTIRERLSGLKAQNLRCMSNDGDNLCFSSKDPSLFEELYQFWTGNDSYSV